MTGVDDPLSQNKSYDYWSAGAASLLNSIYGSTVFSSSYVFNWWNSSPLNAYGMPLDRTASGAIGLDPLGCPIFAQMGSLGDYIDDPYEIAISGKSGTNLDQPYASPSGATPSVVHELETVLRQFDSDVEAASRSGLPPLVPATFQNSGDSTGTHYLKVTTDSWDLPCPGITVNGSVLGRLQSLPSNSTVLAELGAGGPGITGLNWFPPQHVRDLLAIKMYLDLRTQSTPVAAATAARWSARI